VTSRVAELLREARRSAGLTQGELARRSGVSQPHVSAYENGRREPSVPTITRLIEASGHELVLSLRVPAYRPMSLADIAHEIPADQPGARGGRWFWVREFLRGFTDDAGHDERAALILKDPAATGERVWDAILAAVAEHLSFHHDLPCPRWVHEPGRFAGHAWFLSDLPTQRAWAVETSPASFRRRNLFILPADLGVA
jgi:transcriptional regulator with XRE-family HTH domain